MLLYCWITVTVAVPWALDKKCINGSFFLPSNRWTVRRIKEQCAGEMALEYSPLRLGLRNSRRPQAFRRMFVSLSRLPSCQPGANNPERPRKGLRQDRDSTKSSRPSLGVDPSLGLKEIVSHRPSGENETTHKS